MSSTHPSPLPRQRKFDEPSPPRAAPSPMTAASPCAAPRRLTSAQLLDGGTEVEIEHRGSMYRLRLTSLDKLILTK
jgi:hemin uptake protein HemP